MIIVIIITVYQQKSIIIGESALHFLNVICSSA